MITISSLLIISALSCPKTVIVNATNLKWNKYDDQALSDAKKRCGELYPDAPCVKLFRKFNFQSYSVICGAENKK